MIHCLFIQNIGQHTPIKRSVSWEDLIQIPTRIRPTGPGGRGRGWQRGGKLPNQRVTSPETMKYIEECELQNERKEKIKKEKESVCRKALLQKSKHDRLVNKIKKGWQTSRELQIMKK